MSAESIKSLETTQPDQLLTPAVVRIALSSLEFPEFADPAITDFSQQSIIGVLEKASIEKLPFGQINLLSYHQQLGKERFREEEIIKFKRNISALTFNLDRNAFDA